MSSRAISKTFDVAEVQMPVDQHRRKWTAEDDELFRRLVDANTRPEDIAAKLGCTLQSLKTRGYQIGLPLKWFRARLQRLL